MWQGKKSKEKVVVVVVVEVERLREREGRGREEGEQVTLMERRSPNTRGLQERGNKSTGQRDNLQTPKR
jgi:hypothetical protein